MKRNPSSTMEPSQPANSRPESTQLATFRSTVRYIESILRLSTISTSHAEQVKSQLDQLEGQFQRLLEAREVGGQSERAQAIATTRPNPLARLPDLCLLTLFEQLPLLDQLTARQTCARWSTLMLVVTQTRSSLYIYLYREYKKVNYAETVSVYDGTPDVFWSEKIISQLQADDGSPLFPCRHLTAWSKLSVASLSATLNEQIGVTFSRIKKLELKVLFKKPNNAEHLVSLVERLGPSLEAFHLKISFSLMSQPLADRLFAAINSMSSLVYLNLNLDDHISHHDLPIISRIEELHFDCDSTSPDQFAEMLQRYGEGNGALRRICYDSPSRPLSLAPFTRLSRRLRDCFTRVDLRLSPLNEILLCGHFRSLTSFDLCLHFPISIRHLFALLSQLTQLTLLRLQQNSNNLRPDRDALHDPLAQLPSVVMLQLQPSLRSHRDLDHLALPWTMPNLKGIYFDLHGSRCTDCHDTVFPIKRMPANLEPVKECTRQLFRPLTAQCARLRLISHSEEEVIGTAEELLA